MPLNLKINEIERNKFDLIIVEGTMILYDNKILNTLDLKIYIDTRADERAVRYINAYSKYHGHDFIMNSYLDLVRYRMDEYVEPTKNNADLIVNGSLSLKKALEVIKIYLQTKIL